MVGLWSLDVDCLSMVGFGWLLFFVVVLVVGCCYLLVGGWSSVVCRWGLVIDGWWLRHRVDLRGFPNPTIMFDCNWLARKLGKGGIVVGGR